MSNVVFADDLQMAKDAYDRHDYEKAKEIYTTLANSGNAEAQNSLGYLYESGQGTRTDYQGTSGVRVKNLFKIIQLYFLNSVSE